MLKFVIIIFLALFLFHIIYSVLKKKFYYWDKELFNSSSLTDQKNKIKEQEKVFNEDLKSKEKELKQMQEEINNLKK